MSMRESASYSVFENHSQDTRYRPFGDICQTVSATWGMGGNNQPLVVGGGSNLKDAVVRRLTPKECERLQGFPDDHTNIGEWVDSNGKKHKPADSPRYKALGNSIALPFWSWLAERIVAQLKEDGVENPEMASLFDGIGGFPLVFQRAGCKPIWASEIEEFPIAVTKRRFPEESEHEETNNQLAVSGNDPDSEKRGQLF